MPPLLTPLDGHGPSDGFDGFAMLPFISSFLLLCLIVGLAALYLWRQGRLPLPGLGTRRSPEDEAKHILADRFARGTISTDEFMERSSILNWTPGSDPVAPRGLLRKRR